MARIVKCVSLVLLIVIGICFIEIGKNHGAPILFGINILLVSGIICVIIGVAGIFAVLYRNGII